MHSQGGRAVPDGPDPAYPHPPRDRLYGDFVVWGKSYRVFRGGPHLDGPELEYREQERADCRGYNRYGAHAAVHYGKPAHAQPRISENLHAAQQAEPPRGEC